MGAGSNLQDGTTITTSRPSSVHSDSAWDTIVGDNVTVGHNVALHGCTIEDEALIGMGATVMQGALVQKGAMVAAGAVVPPDTVIPAGEEHRQACRMRALHGLLSQVAEICGGCGWCTLHVSLLHECMKVGSVPEERGRHCQGSADLPCSSQVQCQAASLGHQMQLAEPSAASGRACF